MSDPYPTQRVHLTDRRAYDEHGNLLGAFERFCDDLLCSGCGLNARACPHRDPGIWCSYHETHEFRPPTAQGGS